MPTLNEIYRESKDYWTHSKFNEIFEKLIEEIEALKKPHCVETAQSVAEEWLNAEEFTAKYPAFEKQYLGGLRTNCSNKEQKFFKGNSYNVRYHPKETFKYIMQLPVGKGRIKNKLIKNNFWGINMED